jgi:hypothetical protein
MLFDQGEGHILRRQVVPIPNFQTLNPSVYFRKKKKKTVQIIIPAVRVGPTCKRGSHPYGGPHVLKSHSIDGQGRGPMKTHRLVVRDT